MAQFTGSPIAMLLVSVLLGAMGQIMLKTGLTNIGKHPAEAGAAAILAAVRSIGNPWVLAGFICYAVSSIIWLMVLKKLDLSYAYPLISVSYVAVVLLSALILHEKPHWTCTIPGLVLIIAGVTLIGIGSK